MNRSFRADLLKALAIFGVVFIHLPISDEIGFSFYFRFGVPLFIAVWALYFNLGLEKRPPSQRMDYVKARLWRLLVPYVFWTCCYLLYFHPSISEWTNTPLHTIIGGWWGGYGWAGQFFFIVLFQLTFFVLFYRAKINLAGLFSLLVAYLSFLLAVECVFWKASMVSGIGDRLFIYWIPYCILGVAISRGTVPHVSPGLLVPLAIAFLAAAPIEYRAVYSEAARASPYLLVSVFLGATAMILVLVPPEGAKNTDVAGGHPLIENSRRNPQAIFSYLSHNTFPIFLMNPLIIDFLFKDDLLGKVSSPLPLAFRFTSACLVIAIALVIAMTFRFFRLGILVGMEGRATPSTKPAPGVAS